PRRLEDRSALSPTRRATPAEGIRGFVPSRVCLAESAYSLGGYRRTREGRVHPLADPLAENALTFSRPRLTFVLTHKVGCPGTPYFPPVEALWALEEGVALMNRKSSRTNRRAESQPSVLML